MTKNTLCHCNTVKTHDSKPKRFTYKVLFMFLAFALSLSFNPSYSTNYKNSYEIQSINTLFNEQKLASPNRVKTILVGFRDDVSQYQAEKVIKKNKANIIKRSHTRNIYRVSTPAGLTIMETIKLFRAEPSVYFVKSSQNRQNSRY